MCGRFTLKTPAAELAAAFDLIEPPPDLGPRYNIAPSLDLVAVTNADPRRARLLRWGLVPYWADDPAIGNRLANARADSVAIKPSFREALKRRRCLVLADGFYEWQAAGKDGKRPFWFHLRSGAPFALAGLWETWVPPGTPTAERDLAALHTCCLVTTEPNAVVAQVHDRMPVIVDPTDFGRWLQPEPVSIGDVGNLLRPFAADKMAAREVTRYVNTAANEGPRCLEPAAPRLF
ncbi:MAG: SOS response-associated peptidase [Myxococcales bacterium]|nr:SOS response-associated peptidase [Myxococcales bacterium]